MGKSYSQDLRLRVLGALDEGMSQMEAHRVFGIRRSTIDEWLERRQETGAVAVKKPNGAPPAIADLSVFENFASGHSGCTLSGHSGCTLDQMSQAWQKETGCKFSRNTFSRALRKMGWTRKKRV